MEQELVHTSKKTGNQSRFWQSDRQDRLKTSLSAYLKKKLGVFSTSELTIVFFLHSFFLPFKLEPFPAQCVVLHSFTSYSFPTSFLSFDNHYVGLAFTESRKQMVSLILWGEKKNNSLSFSNFRIYLQCAVHNAFWFWKQQFSE